MSSIRNSPVVVTGDVTVDWNLARTKGFQGGGTMWNVDDCTRAFPQPGGAALLGALIETVAKRLARNPINVIRPVLPDRFVPSDTCYHHSYAMWSLNKYGERPAEEKEKPAWRVEEFLGLDRCIQERDESHGQEATDVTSPSLIVIDDANLGFRDQERQWPKALTAKRSSPWTIVKMAQPVARGELWQFLQKQCAEKLIVVMTVNDLRLTEVQISRQISWERTAQDLAWELVHNPEVNSLSRCAHVVVSFDTAGAFLLSRQADSPRPRCQLFFDPRVTEGMWERDYRGYMIGHTVALTAGLARQVLLSPAAPAIEQGIQTGLAGMRRLHREGYGRRGSTVAEANLSFPLSAVAEDLEGTTQTFAVVDVQDPVRFLDQNKQPGSPNGEPGFWTILADRYTGALESVAERIVLEGPESALTDVPLGQFGKLLTVDRHEIESFRSIGSLIDEYCRQKKPKRPLSIAVFGAPGAGKSFGIVEVAKSLLPGQIEVREFNVSQFASAEDILEALHQVRDVGLSGQIPLVFWDEFDTSLQGQSLGWLRYFLAPMQDGRFQQGQITHPIGRAIFVFAGGTCENMSLFDRGSDDKEFKNVKGPDFVSRLKGYVNILGPNTKDPAADPYFVIRRAIILRSILQRDASQLFHRDGKTLRLRIDRGVLRAMLRTQTYKHGVRSMESVIAMSGLAGKRTFERSALPAEEQLNLHVNARNFLALMQQMDLNGEFLERLAAAAHDVYCDDLRSRGYRHGAQTDDKLKLSSALGPYEALPEDEKEQNRGNVRDIANKLAVAGYVMIPARSNEPPFDFPGPDLEQLAEMEHERWMRLKLERGWRYGERTDKKKAKHDALLPWRKLSAAERASIYGSYEKAIGSGVLPESEKKKDRILVRGIPRILARAGYTVLKVNVHSNDVLDNKSENGQNRRNRTPVPNRSRKS
jgi:RyR domain